MILINPVSWHLMLLQHHIALAGWPAPTEGPKTIHVVLRF
jgi:hypothetical protein